VKILAVLFALLLLFPLLGQEQPAPVTTPLSKEALRQRIADLKVKAFEMQTRIEVLEKQLQDVEEAERNKPIPVAAGKTAAPQRCAGHTKDGARCSRNAVSGSRFCWQHKARR